MEVIHALLDERNSIETKPFISLIESNVTLNATVFELQNRLDVVQTENVRFKDDVDKVSGDGINRSRHAV